MRSIVFAPIYSVAHTNRFPFNKNDDRQKQQFRIKIHDVKCGCSFYQEAF